MGNKSKFIAKHGLQVNTTSGSTPSLKFPSADGSFNQFIRTDGSGNLSFDSTSAGGATNFTGLSDTPINYTGEAGKAVIVNPGETGLQFSQEPISNSLNRHAFTGDGTTTNFTTGTNYAGDNYVLVFVDGVIQYPGTNFSLDSTILVFTSAPANNADITVYGTVVAAGFPTGSVTASALENPLTLTGGLTLTGHLLPAADSTYDLGDSAVKWRDLYMAGSTIHIGGKKIQADTSGIVLPAGSKIGSRSFRGGTDFDSSLKGTYGSASAIPILKLDSTGMIDSVGTAPTTSDLVGDTSPQLGGDLDAQGNNITNTGNIELGTSGTIIFEGDSNNSFETTLAVKNPTADRTILLDDGSGTVVTKSVYTGGGHDPSAQSITLQATNNQGTAKLDLGAQGSTLFAAQTDVSAIYSNPTNNGFFTFSDLHIRSGGKLHVDAGPGGAEFNTDILLETGHTLSFEGSTNDSFETTLTVTDPTADRTITFPDSTGTVALQTSAYEINTGSNDAIIHTHRYGFNNSRNFELTSGDTGSDVGLYLKDAGSTASTQIYGTSGHYGFLASAWGNWDLKKEKVGAMDLYGDDAVIRLVSTGNNDRGIEFIQGAAGSTPASGQTKKASILWNEGNANFNFKNFRNDANQSYANMGFFTGGTNSSDPALRLNINYQGSIGFSDSGGSINTDPNQISYGTTGQVLTSKGMNAPPAWEAAPGISSVQSDTSPALGGDLNLGIYAITNSTSTATGSGTSYDLRIEKSTSDYVGFRMKNTANFPTHGMGSPYANWPMRLVFESKNQGNVSREIAIIWPHHANGTNTSAEKGAISFSVYNGYSSAFGNAATMVPFDGAHGGGIKTQGLLVGSSTATTFPTPGNIKIQSGGYIEFGDGTQQSTAPTGGMTVGKSIALGLAFG